jgi:hypothetical protein
MGKGFIREIDNEAQVAFKLNLKTCLGKEWYEAMRFDLEHEPAKMEWSYGFSVVESENGEFQDQQVRFLKKLQVHEVSPVLLGAGIGTRTLAMKQAAHMDPGVERAYIDHTVKWHERFLSSRMEHMQQRIRRLRVSR